jgi:hypothetical protein
MKRPLIGVLTGFALLVCSVIPVSAVKTRKLEPCPSVKPFVYPDGSRVVSAKDPTLDNVGKRKTGRNLFLVKPIVAVPSGVAIVRNLRFAEPQAIVAPQSQGEIADVYSQACGSVDVFTIDGLQRLPLFLRGGLVVVERPLANQYWYREGGYRGIYSENVCIPGDVHPVEGQLVFLVWRIEPNVCETRSGRPFLKQSDGSFALVSQNSARRLLTSHPVPNMRKGRLDSALLIEDVPSDHYDGGR